MAINFMVNDVVRVDQTYVDITLRKTNTRTSRAAASYLGYIRDIVLTVTATGNISGLSFIRLVPVDTTHPRYRGGSGVIVYFDSDEQLNNSLELANSFYCDYIGKKVFNNSGSTLNKGEVVYYTGYNATEGLPEVDLASAAATPTALFFGILEEDIDDQASGSCAIGGAVSIDTGSMSVNDLVYLSNTPGEINPTSSQGTVPVIIGRVLTTGTNGSIQINGQQMPSSGGGGGGAMGATGIQGPTGIQGNTGFQGDTGIQGNTGIDGATGIQGIAGTVGTPGTQGVTGFIGATGIQGDTGIQGSTGAGVQGVTGFQGVTGTQGNQGDTGIQGTTGIQGNTGTGNQGNTGIQGTQGDQGDTGIAITGATGIQGPGGMMGDTGIAGITGLQGIQGNTGIDGETGVQGLTGIIGAPAQTGATGIQGLTGIGGVATGSISILATVDDLDLTIGANSFPVYSVPGGMSAVIQAIVYRLTTANGITTEATVSAGWDPSTTNVFTPQTTTAVTSANDLWTMDASAKSILGTAGSTLLFGVTGMAGNTGVGSVDIVGYEF